MKNNSNKQMSYEQAITILYALKNEYIHPEVKEACDIAISCVKERRDKQREERKHESNYFSRHRAGKA